MDPMYMKAGLTKEEVSFHTYRPRACRTSLFTVFFFPFSSPGPVTPILSELFSASSFVRSCRPCSRSAWMRSLVQHGTTACLQYEHSILPLGAAAQANATSSQQQKYKMGTSGRVEKMQLVILFGVAYLWRLPVLLRYAKSPNFVAKTSCPCSFARATHILLTTIHLLVHFLIFQIETMKSAEKERGRRASRKGPGGGGRRGSAFFLNEVTVHAARVSVSERLLLHGSINFDCTYFNFARNRPPGKTSQQINNFADIFFFLFMEFIVCRISILQS